MPDKIPPRRETHPSIYRCVELGTGFLTWEAYEYAFDYALYPFVIWKLGPRAGGAVMALVLLAFCLLLLRLYDRMGRDWLGLESVKSEWRKP